MRALPHGPTSGVKGCCKLCTLRACRRARGATCGCVGLCSGRTAAAAAARSHTSWGEFGAPPAATRLRKGPKGHQSHTCGCLAGVCPGWQAHHLRGASRAPREAPALAGAPAAARAHAPANPKSSLPWGSVSPCSSGEDEGSSEEGARDRGCEEGRSAQAAVHRRFAQVGLQRQACTGRPAQAGLHRQRCAQTAVSR